MKNKEVVKLELQLGTEQAEISLDKVANSITGLRNTIASAGSEISKLFETVQINADVFIANVQQIAAPIDQLSESLNMLAALDFNSLITQLNDLQEVLNRIFEQMEEQQAQDLMLESISSSVDAAQLGWDIYKKVGSKKTKSTYNSKGGIKVKVRKKGADSKSGASGITAGGIGAAMGLDEDLGDYDTLTSLFSNLGSVVSDAGQKMRDFGSAIGSAFSKFGTTIAQLASSTGVWIANTAAKVGNTAAQWAQIAAVTAWQALCTVATAVTTAFGAAMTFLTSPIGLVVVAVTALIAIIALLIANWDTVSAKIQQGCNFIQSVLQGFDDFLQGVFATDFTEQFGAFGNILNAFFANVENAWNAVKSIFGGVISFVKNVFAGDWIGVWNSLVSMFIGIWDGMVTQFKMPINGIIGLLNTLLQRIVDRVNVVIDSLNVTASVIPGMGGKTLVKPWVAPKIPYLARGAVLPANKPFLAVLGDQRHGNNIEAPEGLIRDIFKEEMGDFLGGMMAGFEALLAENRSLRAVVECIEVGDTTIGQAANRYNDKMAVVRGRA